MPGYQGPAERAGRVQVHIHGYVVVKLESSDIKNYQEDVCTLVIDDTPFHNDTPLTIGTNIIDHAIGVMTESEQSLLTEDWTRAVAARELATPMGYVKPLKGAHYNCKLAGNEDFSPQEMKIIRVITDLQVYGCQAYVFMGHSPCMRLLPGVTIFQTYTEATPSSRTIQMVVQNTRTMLITLRKHMRIRYCVLATKVMDSAFNPPEMETEEQEMWNVADMLASLPYEQFREETQLLVKKAHITIPNQIRLIQDALIWSDLTKPLSKGEQWAKVEETLKLDGLTMWTGKNAERAKETLLWNHRAFSVEKLEMGKTDVVRHQINLTDPKPFKE